MKRILTLLIPAFCATSAFAINITPFLTCVVPDPVTQTTTAYFGYESFEPAIVTIVIGGDNRFIPGAPGQGQPQLFFPGYFEKAFRVTFPTTETLLWGFNGFVIAATNTSLRCPSVTLPPPALPPGTVALSYSQPLAAIGGQGGLTWTATSPLPSGLILAPGGLLSGTPQIAGQFAFTVQATDGITTTQRTYGMLIGNGVTISDAASTRAPGFTPQFRVVTAITATITARASCDVTEFVISGGGACSVPNSNTVLGRVAASAPAANGWQVTCSGGTATAVAVCSKP